MFQRLAELTVLRQLVNMLDGIVVQIPLLHHPATESRCPCAVVVSGPGRKVAVYEQVVEEVRPESKVELVAHPNRINLLTKVLLEDFQS